MAIRARTLLLIITISFSVLFLSIYIYSKDLSKSKQIKLSNERKILLDKSNNYLRDKIVGSVQNSSNFGFMHSFFASISVIVVSEICDKTFFIAAFMAMRHSLFVIYTGATSALGTMAIISALLGNVATKFIPRIYIYYLSSILFVCFGINMLKNGYNMPINKGTDEYKESQYEIGKAEAVDDLKSKGGSEIINNSIKQNRQKHIVMIIRRYISPIFIEAFIMTFLAVSIQ